jgi:hypothetical protein
MDVAEYVLAKFRCDFWLFLNCFIIQSQGVFKNRIGSRGSDVQLNHSGLQLHSVRNNVLVALFSALMFSIVIA